MTKEDLRAFLEAHGTDGAPPMDGRPYVVETMTGTVAIYISTERDHATMAGWFSGDDRVYDLYVERHKMARHAPLPPLADVAALRRRIADMEGVRDEQAAKLRRHIDELRALRVRLAELEASDVVELHARLAACEAELRRLREVVCEEDAASIDAVLGGYDEPL